MDYKELGSYARGVYPTQDTSSMEITRVKQEEEADIKIIAEESKKYRRNESGHKGEKPRTRPK